MAQFSGSPGAIYPALRRLRARKWVSAIRQKTSARKREEFQITQTGRRALLDWLRQPLRRAEVVHGLQVLLLRFAFFDGNLARNEICRSVTALEQELNAYVRELEGYGESSGLLNSRTTGALAFRNGLDGYRTHLSWVRSVRRTFSCERRQ